MASEEWYRNKIWNEIVATDFEARLKRSRGAYNKAQYLRIQASYLLNSDDSDTQLAGVSLMERLLKDYPEEEFSVVFAQEQLGDYYIHVGAYKKAEMYYRLVTDHYRTKNTRSGTSGLADLKLAETILNGNIEDKFEEAYKLCKNHPVDSIILNSDKFYHAALSAQVCERMNKKEEAKQYAKVALAFSYITEPQFSRHKTVGLVNATDIQLMELEHIVNQ
ncbi:hypothetical protein OCK74_27550 [Chitinophagaceae bacterium LB-8]|uniref:Tetratricopeptide repeat protein n=1 Tax=Paraflavisolibacter caeni TaxID=2982496 RepID=A0A9X3BAK1_9BACT|nr:hypothetical protein [Paraflavisolibacter caeni]MCU7552906.1 hypothetical protein [Paraflavisolibacter caeni]